MKNCLWLVLVLYVKTCNCVFYTNLGFQVVPSDSAILPGYIPIGIRSNHMDMTKFEHAEDPGFTAVAGELRRWVKALDVSSNAAVTGAVTSQQQQAEQVQRAQCTRNSSVANSKHC